MIQCGKCQKIRFGYYFDISYKKFELEKIIKRDNKKLVILDKDKLEELAGDLYQ